MEILGICFILAAVVIFGCWFFLFKLNPDDDKDILTLTEQQDRSDQLRILTADQLFQLVDADPLIAVIRENLRVSPEVWANDVEVVLRRIAEFVQRFPASENHHHAQPGGLLQHTLEVAAHAMRLCSNVSWPPGRTTEERKRVQVAWRYGVLAAALFHDLGKALTNLQIVQYAESSELTMAWYPDSGAMNPAELPYYTVSFPASKTVEYEAHTRLGFGLFVRLTPRHVLAWLKNTDPSLLSELEQYLSGDKKSIFNETIVQADKYSVANHLKVGPKTRFSSAKPPLVESLMASLREMLADSGRFFSVGRDAGGGLFRHGDYVFIMSKTLADDLRDFCNKNGNKSVPLDNQRVFDILFEAGAARPNPYQPNKAIWHIDVTFVGKKTPVPFTVICFKLADVYPNGNYPPNYQGSISVMGENGGRPLEEIEPTPPTAMPLAQPTEAGFGSTPIETTPIDLAQSSQSEVERPHVDSNDTNPMGLEQALDVQPSQSLEQALSVGFKIKPNGVGATKDLAAVLPPTPSQNPKPNPIGSTHANTSHGNSNKSRKAKKGLQIASLNMAVVFNEPVSTPTPSSVDQPLASEEQQPSGYAPIPLNPLDNLSNLLASVSQVPIQNTITNEIQPANIEPEQAEQPEVEVTEQAINVDTPYLDEQDSAKTAYAERIAAMPAEFLSPVALPAQEEPFGANPLDFIFDAPKTNDEVAQSENGSQVKTEQDLGETLQAKRLAANQLGRKFINWLQTNLAENKLEYNTAKSLLHFTEDGLFLLSPGIFFAFCELEMPVNRRMPPEVSDVQKGFEIMGLHKKTDRKRSNQWKIKTIAAEGKRATVLTVYWIEPSNQAYFIRGNPPFNPHLDKPFDQI